MMPGEIEKTPTQHTSASKPASGTYGEKADLNRLKASLPESGARPAPDPGAQAPMGGGPGVRPLTGDPGRPGGPSAPPGVPGALMHETTRPNQPVSTPLAGQAPAMGGAQSAVEARLVVLQALSESDQVSDATREWAKTVLEMLADG